MYICVYTFSMHKSILLNVFFPFQKGPNRQFSDGFPFLCKFFFVILIYAKGGKKLLFEKETNLFLDLNV